MIRTLTMLFLIFGIILFFYALTLSAFKDGKTADDFLAKSYEFEKSEYYNKESELRTYKNLYMDLGSGIIIASTVILIFLYISKIKNVNDLQKIYTFNKQTIFISSNLIWLLIIPGTYLYYIFRSDRGDYPPFADSIAIPLMTQIPLFLFLIIPLNIFLFVTTFNANLPTKLFIKPDRYSKKTTLWEIFFCFWIIINLIFFVSFVADGDHISIFVNLFFAYILLNLRAGQMTKFQHESASL